MSKGCCSSPHCGVGIAKCPVCGALGQPVPLETVKSMTRTNMPAADEFSVCMTADCNVVYFSRGTVFYKADIVVPVAWKDGTTPKYICYCNRVTEEEIIRAIIEDGAKTVGDVAKATGAMKNGQCIVNNPKGTCCHKDIERIIQRVLENR